MRGALENGGGGDPAGGAFGGKHQPEVGAAVLDAGDAVGQEADADDALAGAEAAGHRRVGGGIQGDVLIQRQQIVVPAEQLRLLPDGAEQQPSRPVVCIVGGPEQLLIPEVQQLGPARGGIDRHALEHIPVDDEAQRIHADAIPEPLRVAVQIVRQVGGVGGVVGGQQTGVATGGTVLGAAAEPHIRGGMTRRSLRLGLHAVGGHILVGGTDAEQLLEALAGGGEIRLLAGAADRQLALGPGGGEQLLHAVEAGGTDDAVVLALRRDIVGCLVAAGGERQRQYQYQQLCEKFFHMRFLRLRAPDIRTGGVCRP